MGLAIALPPLVAALVPDLPPGIVPSLGTGLLWAIPALLSGLLQLAVNRWVFYVWFALYLLGTINLVASYYAFGDVYLIEADPAGKIYIAFVTVIISGLLVGERLFRSDSKPIPTGRPEWSPVFRLILLVFPVAYIADLMLNVGYIPMLQGGVISEDMYDLSYGRLYGYGLVLVAGMLQATLEVSKAREWSWRAVWGLALVAMLLIGLADGRRIYAVLFGLALIPMYLARPASATSSGPRWAWVWIGLAGVLTYVGVLFIRTGMRPELASALELQFSVAGVEYRDFVLSVNILEPGRVPGYSWLSSTVCAFVNGTVLQAFGIDKLAEVYRGSAYVWRDIFGSRFGIRTGIISELFFGYGWWGVIPTFLFGLAVAGVGHTVAFSRTNSGATFGAVLWALLVVMVVGQSTVTAGSITVLLYLYLVYWVAERLRPVGFPRALAQT